MSVRRAPDVPPGHALGELLAHHGAVVNAPSPPAAVGSIWGDSTATRRLQERVAELEQQVKAQNAALADISKEFYQRKLEGKSPNDITLVMETTLRALGIHLEFKLKRKANGMLADLPEAEQRPISSMTPIERQTKQTWGREDTAKGASRGFGWMYENDRLKHGA